MNPTVVMYSVYLAISIGLTIWVARTLHRNGRVFLVDVFSGNAALADSVNHLLVVGFYLVNFGFVCLALPSTGMDILGARDGMELGALKIGRVLVMLGSMHFFNLYVFSRIRRRSTMATMPPPLPPDGFVRA